jgi:hypothetical protein
VATDAAGNKDSCQFTVTMNDTEKPVVNCPVDIVVSNTPGQCSRAVAYTAFAIDNCGPPFTPAATLSCTPPSGFNFPVGATNVLCVATDAAGNADSCSFTVTVNDSEAPAVQCPSDTVLCGQPGDTGRTVDFSATASDNCPGVILTCTPASGSVFPVGLDTVVCTAADSAGNQASCSFTVTVKPFVQKGDLDKDSLFTSPDVVLMLNCVFLGAGNCDLCFADVNCDGVLTSQDVVIELNSVFSGDPFPCAL